MLLKHRLFSLFVFMNIEDNFDNSSYCLNQYAIYNHIVSDHNRSFTNQFLNTYSHHNQTSQNQYGTFRIIRLFVLLLIETYKMLQLSSF